MAMTPNWVRSAQLPHPQERGGNGSAERVHGAYEPAVTRDDGMDVLLIEDDESIAQMYALGLNLGGFRVHVAASGDSALSEAASQTRFVAIVLGFELRQPDGLVTLDGIRQSESNANVPVIVLSNANELDFAEVQRRGASECHLMYRTTPRQLVTYVERAMRGAA
jgi:DNA-binding response OmpR family regulator